MVFQHHMIKKTLGRFKRARYNRLRKARGLRVAKRRQATWRRRGAAAAGAAGYTSKRRMKYKKGGSSVPQNAYDVTATRIKTKYSLQNYVNKSALRMLPMSRYMLQGNMQVSSVKGYQNDAVHGLMSSTDLDAVAAADAKTNDPKEQWVIMGASLNYQVSNRTTLPVNLWVYDCICKQTNSINLETSWSDGLTDDAAGAFWLKSRQFMAPQQSRKFNQRWKIRSCKKYMLGAGGIMTYVQKWTGPRRVTRTLWENDTNIKGLTCSTLFVIMGTPVNDVGVVGVGEASVNVTYAGQITFKIPEANAPNIYNTSTGPIQVVTQNAVNAETDSTMVLALS